MDRVQRDSIRLIAGNLNNIDLVNLSSIDVQRRCDLWEDFSD